MEKTNRIGDLFRYLQDPHHVARFQQFCGVRGTFSRSVSPGPGVKEADRTKAHNNGALHHLSGESGSNITAKGAGEGEKSQTAAAGVRQRIAAEDCVKKDGENGNVAQNGAAVTATAAAGENDRSFAAGHAGSSGAEAGCSEDGVPAPARSSTIKPLRKNSLTGDAGQEFLIENKFLYYMFTFGTELGNEFFYITFFPFLMWNVDAFVSRRLIMVWVWVMYLGQCTKDVIGWSRPSSPPVVKVEMFYNSEYSMPSTHAMSGTAIPFSLFLLTYGRWEYPFTLGFSLALCWCLLVCVSRIYMGMHSILDVIAGVLYSVIILLFFLPVLDLIDTFNLTCRYAPLIIISLHLGLGLFSFTLDTWSTSRGDTAQILGTGAGVALASHVNHLLGLMPDPPPEALPFSMPPLSLQLVGLAVLRLFLGVLVLVATRALMKAFTIPLVCRVFGIPSGDVRKARQHMEVELPYRYIVYGTVGFNVLFLVPFLFSYLQLS
ncbi:sphingosine-1-phosphate phosphatase 1 [Myripristis murdjan]|uniref:Sphingosine-1-phosphate phosphatase 1 n=1 Tax=Myripristis murdjan TaxID=586833 RepID=A0A667Y591_9TELE|nr:sphingosine-1-phosphate phosphatase 1 [Myripristis murdjan]